MYQLLDALRDALAQIETVKTCRIGLEPNITPDDYPIVRIVPARVIPGATPIERRLELWVYYGVPIHESASGIESVYEGLLDLDAEVRRVMRTAGSGFGVRFIETITDEDRLEHFKLFASRFEAKILGL